MTFEELEEEAKEYGKKSTAWLEDREPLDQRDIENAYLAGAKPREKRITELEAQIDKMRCCENCYHHRFWGNDLGCNLDYDTEFECLKTKNKWRLWEE